MQELGAELWVVAPDDMDKLADLREKKGLGFPVLADPGCTICCAYGVLNESSGEIPHPTAVVIDTGGVVRFVRVDVDYKVRPAPEELFEALRDLP